MGLLSSILSFGQNKKRHIEFPKQEKYDVVEAKYDDKPAMMIINRSYKRFKAKDVFGWTCSLVITYQDLTSEGMPTHEECVFVDNYIDELSKTIIGDKSHRNAIMMIEVTYNGTIEVIWQVNNPEPVHEFLKGIIESKTYPRDMDYRIEREPDWKTVMWYLKTFK